MCGRFSVDSDQIDEWITGNFDTSFQSSTNIDLRPSQTVSTIIKANNSIQQLNTSWGIKPGWSKKLIINARSETAASKNLFKQ